MVEQPRPTTAIVYYLFLLCVSLFLLTTSLFNATYTDASRARYETTKALVERGDLSIPDGSGIKGRDGKDYSWYGIGKSLLAVPFYVAGEIVGRPESVVAIMNQLYGAASVVVVFLFCLSLGYTSRASVTAQPLEWLLRQNNRIRFEGFRG